jgi:hypothetical protein
MASRRTKSIGTKVTPEEYARIQTVAGDQPVSEWVRAALLKAAEAPAADPAVLAELLALRAILLNLHFHLCTSPCRGAARRPNLHRRQGQAHACARSRRVALIGAREIVRTGIGARHATPDLSTRIDRSHDGRRVLIRPRCSAVSRVPFGGFAALDTASAPCVASALTDGHAADAARLRGWCRPLRASCGARPHFAQRCLAGGHDLTRGRESSWRGGQPRLLSAPVWRIAQ